MKLRNLVKICAAAKDLLALLCSCKSILAFLFTTFFMHISNIAALWHAFWSCTHSCFTCLLSFYIVLSPAAPWAAMCGPLGRNVPSKKNSWKIERNTREFLFITFKHLYCNKKGVDNDRRARYIWKRYRGQGLPKKPFVRQKNMLWKYTPFWGSIL